MRVLGPTLLGLFRILRILGILMTIRTELTRVLRMERFVRIIKTVKSFSLRLIGCLKILGLSVFLTLIKESWISAPWPPAQYSERDHV